MLQNLGHRFVGVFLATLLIPCFLICESCHAENSRGENFSLLSGKVESHGTMRKTCSLSKDGDLIMSIESRTGDYAMCCVSQPKPVEVRIGQEVSAEINLERNEGELHVKLETDEKQIFLYNHHAEAGRLTLDNFLLDNESLGGKKSVEVLRFCIAAVGGGGPLQTIRVSKAAIAEKPTVPAASRPSSPSLPKDWSTPLSKDRRGHLDPESFQDFEVKNGTPGNGSLENYCRNIWYAQCEFEPKLSHTGKQALLVKVLRHQSGNEKGGTVRIFASSRSPINVLNGRIISAWIYDTNGNNTVELKLCNGDKCPDRVWSAMRSTKNQWSEITWPISSFTNIDKSGITAIEMYEYNDGIYYVDDITWQ